MNTLFLVLSYCDFNILFLLSYCNLNIIFPVLSSCDLTLLLLFFFVFFQNVTWQNSSSLVILRLVQNFSFWHTTTCPKYSYCHITWLKISLSCHIVTWLIISQSYDTVTWLESSQSFPTVTWLKYPCLVNHTVFRATTWLSIFGLVDSSWLFYSWTKQIHMTSILLVLTTKHDHLISGLITWTWLSYFWYNQLQLDLPQFPYNWSFLDILNSNLIFL